MIVVIDSNIWLSELGLNSLMGSAVRFFINNNSARIALPEVIRLEVERNFRNYLKDMVAYWIYRYYQSHDSRGFDLIKPYIHIFNNGDSGLVELVSEQKKAEIIAQPSPDVEKYPFPSAMPEDQILPAAMRRELQEK